MKEIHYKINEFEIKIINATSKEEFIIKKWLRQSLLKKYIDKIIVINDFVDTFCEKHYPNHFYHGNKDEDKKLYGMHAFNYETNKSDIIISSIDFIKKNPDKRYDFTNLFLHELGHAYYAQIHLQEYDKFLKKILPKSKMMYDIAQEVIADVFRDALLSGEVNQKKV